MLDNEKTRRFKLEKHKQLANGRLSDNLEVDDNEIQQGVEKETTRRQVGSNNEMVC